MVRDKRSPIAVELNRHVGRKIAACRREAGLDLIGLASRTHFSVRTLARIEAGAREADVGQLLAIAEALKLSVAALFDGFMARMAIAPAQRPSAERLRETEVLVQVYRRIADAEQRRRIVALLKACAESGRY
jgi:transcriptional regulator with XRE-family HTH domain